MIVPCGVTVSMKEDEKKSLFASCRELEESLRKKCVRVEGDYRDNYSPGWKFNHWELKVILNEHTFKCICINFTFPMYWTSAPVSNLFDFTNSFFKIRVYPLELKLDPRISRISS